MLTALQERVARRFFSLPESAGFALAGGGALAVRAQFERSTRDLDLFVADQRAVRVAAVALERALAADGFHTERVRDFPTYAKLIAHKGDASVAIDLGFDFRWRPAEDSSIGPVLSSEELAVDKLLALFGRAEARDFVDVFFLAQRHGIDRILAWAPEKDGGFDRYYLARNLELFDRRSRQSFAVDDATFAEMEEFYADLRARLMAEVLDGEPRWRP